MVLHVDGLPERWSFCKDCIPRDSPPCALWEDVGGVGWRGQHHEGWRPDSPSCLTVLLVPRAGLVPRVLGHSALGIMSVYKGRDAPPVSQGRARRLSPAELISQRDAHL